MTPASAEEIAAACAALARLGDFPADIAAGLAAGDPDQMRAAAAHLIEAGRLQGLGAIVARFRGASDFGVWARVTGAALHRAEGDFAGALADIDDLMARFPARAAPHWWIARARALEGLGRIDAAAACLREGIARFPAAPAPRAILANLFGRAKRWPEALAAWREAHARFPEAELPWFVGLAQALTATGARDQALAALEEAGRSFPDDPRSPALLAEVAESRWDFARALGVWDASAARFGADADSEIGAARALFRLERPDEACARLDAFLARDPDHAAALRERAAMALALGEAAHARAIWTRLTAAADARAPAWAARARAEHDDGDFAAGAASLAELERRFPHSPLAAHERLRLARAREFGLDALQALIAEARGRFPEDASLRASDVQTLVTLGRLDEAEAETAALEAEADGPAAFAARLRVEAYRGDAALYAWLDRRAAARPWSASEAAAVAQVLLDLRTPAAFARGRAHVEAARARFPGHARLRLLAARFHIALGEDDAALATIDAIPAAYVRSEVWELRAWAEARRGRDDAAKALWAQALARGPYLAIHGEAGRMRRLSPADRPPPGEGVTAVVAYRNESAQIADFLAHHRRLGVRRFVFLDHASDDGSRELALREPDVILYDCPDSFQLSACGRRWMREVIAAEGRRGWGLQIDPDERLVYPGCERIGLDRLVAYLESRGFEAMRGFMLDLYPDRLRDETGRPPPFDAHRWWDDSYFAFGIARPPYRALGGGVRARLFEAKEYLYKVPLWRLDAGSPLNPHETTHMRFADVSVLLLHYKMMNLALRGAGATSGAAFLEPDADIEAIRSHSRYAQRLAQAWREDLVQPGLSRPLGACEALMEASEDYRRWLATTP